MLLEVQVFEQGNYYNPRKSLTLLISSVAVGAALVAAPSVVFATTADAVDSPIGVVSQVTDDKESALETVDDIDDEAKPKAEGNVSASGSANASGSSADISGEQPGTAPKTEDSADSGNDSSKGDQSPADDGTSGSIDSGNGNDAAQTGKADEEGSKPKVDAPVIEDGVYVIESVKDTSKVLDVAGGSTASGTNVQIYTSNMTAAQKWQFTYDKTTGYYTVGLANTNKVLDVKYAGTTSGTNVWIYDKSSGVNNSQLWKLEQVNGAYRLRSKLNNDLVLDLSGGNTGNGANVQVYRANGTAAQLFYFLKTNPNVLPGVKIDDGGYLVVAGGKDSDVTVSVAGGSTANGANVQLDKKNESSSSQRLYFTYDGNGYYTISVGSSGKMLDAASGNLVPGTNVQQWEGNKGDAQKWALRYNEDDGSYFFVNKANNLYLDVNGGSLTSGTNLWLYVGNGTKAQKFWLKALTDYMGGGVYTPDDGVYIIESKKSLTQVIDVSNGSTANGANVQIYVSNMSAAQKWKVTRVAGSDYYTIGLDGTNKVLDIAWGEVRDRANVHIYQSNGTDAQLWKFIKRGDSLMLVSKLRPDLVMDLANGGTANCTNAQVYHANGTAAQQFYLLNTNPDVKRGDVIEDGSFILIAGKPDSGKAVDISGASRSDGANAQLYSNNKTGAQRFYLKSNSDGFYTITSVGTGKVLDVQGNNLVPYTNVQQWAGYGSNGQQWALFHNSDGSYSFISRCNGLALDVAGGNFANGANLQVNKWSGGTSQKFWLVSAPMIDEGIYTINPFGGNKVLDIKNGSNQSGATAQIWDSNGTLAQRFQVTYDPVSCTYRIRTAASGGWLTQGSDGSVKQEGSSKTQADADNQWQAVWNGSYFSLKNLGSGLVMGVNGSTNSKGSSLKMATANGSKGQHFFFDVARLLSEGFYEFHNNGFNGYNLDVAGASKDSGANVQIYQDNNSNAQKFKVSSNGSYYVIQNFNSAKVLGIANGATADGANVQQWVLNNSKSQLWEARIADGGGIYLINVNSGRALTAESNGNVDVRTLDVAKQSQRWTLEATKAIGWFSEGNAWAYYYEDGSRGQFTAAAKRCWDRIVNTYSATQYLIMVDTANYRTVVFKGRAGNWAPLYDWLCGVGMSGHETEKGDFTIGGDGACYNWTRWHDGRNKTKGGYRATYYPEDDLKYFTGYCLDIGFHSCIGWEGGYSDWSQLGKGISHGCVRLIEANAKWIYDNAMPGTKVRIV